MGKYEDLEGYKKLLDNGGITQEEFERLKNEILNPAPVNGAIMPTQKVQPVLEISKTNRKLFLTAVIVLFTAVIFGNITYNDSKFLFFESYSNAFFGEYSSVLYMVDVLLSDISIIVASVLLIMSKGTNYIFAGISSVLMSISPIFGLIQSLRYSIEYGFEDFLRFIFAEIFFTLPALILAIQFFTRGKCFSFSKYIIIGSTVVVIALAIYGTVSYHLYNGVTGFVVVLLTNLLSDITRLLPLVFFSFLIGRQTKSLNTSEVKTVEQK